MVAAITKASPCIGQHMEGRGVNLEESWGAVGHLRLKEAAEVNPSLLDTIEAIGDPQIKQMSGKDRVG